MKKIITLAISILLLVYFFTVQRVSVDTGEEATIIKKPWFYGEKGIDLNALTEQTIWGVQSTHIAITSIQPFPLNQEFKELLTADNIPIDINLHFIFQHIKGKTPLLIQNFGEKLDWYEKNLKEPLSNTVRNFVKKQTFQQITQEENSSIELQNTITFGIEEFLKDRKVPTKLLDVRVGAINIPSSILALALEEEEAKQKLKTTQLLKEIEEASAEADKAYMRKMNINIKEYIKLQEIEIKKEELNNQRFAIECAKENNKSIQIKMNLSSLK